MKQIYLLFGIMLALMLCITPVAAVSADDFEVDIGKDGRLNMYKYCNMNNPDEEYIDIYTIAGTRWLNSLVTFKPADIEDAPVMVVDTSNKNAFINLSRSVDDWEIKFYSSPDSFSQPDPKYLKNAGVVNLYELFKKYNSYDFYLELIHGKYIMSPATSQQVLIYTIPDALTPEAKVTGDGIKIISSVENGWHQHKYCNLNNPNEKYIVIGTEGTKGMSSLVTFKPANIPDAPVMVVKTTHRNACFYLPYSVDEWEIKYYSCFDPIDQLDDKYLKNAGTVNLKKFFEKCISEGLWLELSWGQYIASSREVITGTRYSIPDV